MPHRISRERGITSDGLLSIHCFFSDSVTCFAKRISYYLDEWNKRRLGQGLNEEGS